MDRRHGASMDDGMGHDGSTTAAAAASGSPMHMTMMAIFQTDMATSLYSAAWTPRNAGAYAGTCIFIIALAMLFRGLLAFKGWQEERWLDGELNRRDVVVNGRESLSRQVSRDSMAKRMVLSENGVEEDVMVLKKKHNHVRPWRLSVDPLRALLDMVIAGVGYLLMIVVMTMNVGYFISVLGGTFLGSLLVGRYAVISEH